MKLTTDYEYIYNSLEGDIVKLVIKPGTYLSENSLCNRFSVSRTPIRSVLQRLQENNLVEIQPRRGTMVTLMNYKIISELIYQRIAVETAVLRDFSPVSTPKDIAQINRCLSIMQNEYDLKISGQLIDTGRFYDADFMMHEIWFKETHKMYLWNSFKKVQADYSRFLRLDMMQGDNFKDVLEEHKEMARLIENHSTDSFEPLISRHLYGGIRRVGDKVFTEYRSYFIPESLEV